MDIKKYLKVGGHHYIRLNFRIWTFGILDIFQKGRFKAIDLKKLQKNP